MKQLRLRWLVCLLGLFAVQPVYGNAEWPEFVKRDEPVYTGQYFVASDPAIIVEDGVYQMWYTSIDFSRDPRAVLSKAVSPDGFSWTPVDTPDSMPGVVLRGREGEWDENLEGAFVIGWKGDYLLYYSGYTDDSNDPAKGFPAALGLAVSSDGVHFERFSDEPIMQPTPGWYDHNAVYSEVIIEHEGRLVMIYVGHCYTRCDYGYGTTLLAATSDDGRTWTKRDQPVLQALPDVDWTRDGVAEPAILEMPDGSFLLFFTGVRDADRWLGMARGESPFGPWDVNPQPILLPTPDTFDAGGVLAPHVILEGDMLRMWYLGVQPVPEGEYYAVGYAEAVLP